MCNICKMGTKEKLINRFMQAPSDFTYDEAKRLFKIFGFVESNKGRTSGSRCEFVSPDGQISFILHKPHPGNSFKAYMLKQMIEFVNMNGLVEKYLKSKEK